MGCSIWESLVLGSLIFLKIFNLGSLVWDSCFGIFVFFDFRSLTGDPYFGIFASGSLFCDLSLIWESLVWDDLCFGFFDLGSLAC